MSKYVVLHHIKQLVTVRGENQLRQGKAMREVEILEDGYLVVKDGKFIAIGQGEVPTHFMNENTEVTDGRQLVVTPGFIDSHTHLVHAGSREHEFGLKLQGVPYLEILKQGGGILDTVRKTRQASPQGLYDQAYLSLDRMLNFGVTRVEAKSGYGLNVEDELKQLEVAKKLNEDHPIDISSTFLGAHALPEEYRDHREEFLNLMIELLPIIKEKNLAEFCDIFCEEGVFSIEESRQLLNYAKKLGFKLKIHADEMSPLGGARLAYELGAISADHLLATTDEDYALLAKGQIVANILPATSFNLNKPFADARKIIDMGCGVALATDYNPGSSPTENLQLVMQLGALKGRMEVNEVITSVTINAACSLGVEEVAGSIDVGKDADFVCLNIPNLDYLLYHFGVNHVKDVYKRGAKVVSNGQLCY